MNTAAARAEPTIHRYETADGNGVGPPFTRMLVVKVRESPVPRRCKENVTVPVPATVASTWIVKGYSLSGERTRVAGSASRVPAETPTTKRPTGVATSREPI